MTDLLPAQIDAVRHFNRFHTRLVGALDEHLLASDYPLPLVRVIYEIAIAPCDNPPTARDLCQVLRMDAGYLSRLVATLEQDGILTRTPSPTHAKRLHLALTAKGAKVFAQLNAKSAAEVADLLAPLTPSDRATLTRAMAQIEGLLGCGPPPAPVTLRDPQPGDLGHVIQAQARLYAQEYGWDWTFEALLSRIVAEYIETFDPSCERCWIAERQGQIIGSIFVVRDDVETAKIRMLYVDPTARGLGLGRSLVQESQRFAKACGYRRMRLWTNDILTAARAIYQAEGYHLVREDPHDSFGHSLVGQIWERDL